MITTIIKQQHYKIFLSKVNLVHSNSDASSVLEKLHNARAGATGDSNSCFRGGFALTSIISDQSTFDEAVNTWLTTTEYDNMYYQVTLRNIFLLVTGGKFSSALQP